MKTVKVTDEAYSMINSKKGEMQRGTPTPIYAYHAVDELLGVEK